MSSGAAASPTVQMGGVSPSPISRKSPTPLSPLAASHGPPLLQPVPKVKPAAAAAPLPPIAPAAATGETPVAAVGSYMEFLRQQQQLQKLGTTTLSTVGELVEQRRRLQTELLSQAAAGMNTVLAAEGSSTWGLHSKYDCAQLVRDCMLDVDPSQLVDKSAVPIVAALESVVRHLASLQQTCKLSNRSASSCPAPEDMKLFFDQSQRRLNALIESCGEANGDYTHIATTLDTLLVSIEQCLDLGDVESLIKDFEDRIDHLAFEIERENRKKDSAIDDGEVQIAEKALYECIEKSEDLIRNVIHKTGTVEKAAEITQSLTALVGKHHANIKPALAQLRGKFTSMKNRCQKDVAKVYALREKVDDVEATTAAKVQKDLAASDDFLRKNMESVEVVFAEMAGLEQRLELLFRERQKEYLRRMAEKDKDEHRRTEYVQFCNVVAEHGSNVERTIKNMDVLIHTCDTVETVGDAGFGTLTNRNEKRLMLLQSLLTECCKQHADTVRSYFAHIGDIQYRKERMVQEIDNSVQQAFIQKELLASTFSPNAKKFGDIKKKLLQSRVELEEDLADITSRSASVMEEFKRAERFLREHKVEFVHPAHAQLERSLGLRARAIESRAIAIGHNEGDPLFTEINQTQEEAVALAKEAAKINDATSGTLGRSIPLLRAASRSIHTH